MLDFPVPLSSTGFPLRVEGKGEASSSSTRGGGGSSPNEKPPKRREEGRRIIFEESLKKLVKELEEVYKETYPERKKPSRTLWRQATLSILGTDTLNFVKFYSHRRELLNQKANCQFFQDIMKVIEEFLR